MAGAGVDRFDFTQLIRTMFDGVVGGVLSSIVLLLSTGIVEEATEIVWA